MGRGLGDEVRETCVFGRYDGLLRGGDTKGWKSAVEVGCGVEAGSDERGEKRVGCMGGRGLGGRFGG